MATIPFLNNVTFSGQVTQNWSGTNITGHTIVANSLSSGSLLSLSSNSTAAASNTLKGLNVYMSGANATTTQSTHGAYIVNTHTGTLSTNYGAVLVTGNAETNIALNLNAYGIGKTNIALNIVGGEVISTGGATFAGNVGIGRTADGARLDINTTDADRYVKFRAPNGEQRFNFYTGGTGNSAILYMYQNDGANNTIRLSTQGNSFFNGGNVGIGVAAPTSKLHIIQTVTDPSLDQPNSFAQHIDSNHSGSTATGGDREQGGLFIDVDSSTTGGTTTDEHRLYGLRTDVRHSGDADLATGASFFVEQNTATGVTTNIYGITSSAASDGGAGATLTNISGINSSASVQDATPIGNSYAGNFLNLSTSSRTALTSNSYGVRSEIQIDSTSSFTNLFAGHFSIDSNAAYTATNSYLLYLDYAGTSLANNIYSIYSPDDVKSYHEGDLGIGTSSPLAKLDVNNDNGTSPHASPTGISVAAGVGGANLLARNGSYHNWFPYTDGKNYYSSEGHVFRNQSHGTTWMTLISNGNVGIGTTSPNAKLAIGNQFSKGTNPLTYAAPNTGVGQALFNSYYVSATDGSGAWPRYLDIAVTGSPDGTNGGSNIRFLTNPIALASPAVERMRITSGGNVGIGTSSPATRFEVADGNAGGNAALDAPVIRIKNTTDAASWTAGDKVGGLEYYTNDASGNAPYVTSFINSLDDIGGTLPSGVLSFGTATYNAVGGAVERMRIDSVGNVGIGNTSPGIKLDVAGGVRASEGFSNDTGGLKLSYPGGGSSNALGNSGTVGAIKITLPVSWSDTMMRMTIKVYEYAVNKSFTLICGGYNYSGTGGTWINEFAYIESQAGLDRNFTVRMGHDGTNCCIYIGELASSWSYPKVYVTDFEAGFNSTSSTTWQDGWNISMEASAFGTITHTSTQNQVNNWQRNGQDVYYGGGTGNVGIGATSPQAPLHVVSNTDLGDALILEFSGTSQGGPYQTFQYSEGAYAPSESGDLWGGIRARSSHGSGAYAGYGAAIEFRQDGTLSATSTPAAIVFKTTDNGTIVQDERMRISHNGNVGIGETDPYAKLEVNGAVHIGPHSAAVNPTDGLLIEAADGGTTQLQMYTLNGSVFRVNSDGTTANIGWGSGADREVNFQNTGAGTLKVGIGTGAPGYSLDVTGTIRATSNIYNNTRIESNGSSNRTKLCVWSSSAYGIGMGSSYTYGGLVNEYAMTFQMSDSANRGWWWGDTAHSNAQGAMSLTTQGKLTVASFTRIGFGEADTTAPSNYGLDVNGYVRLNNDLLLSESNTYSPEIKMSNNTHTLGIDYQNNETLRFITRSGATTVPITFQMRAGTITAVNFILSSDERLKENIKELEPKKIEANWKSFNAKNNKESYRTGVIAQELEIKHPEFVETNDEGFKSVKYIDLLISKIAELEDRIKKLEE